MQRGNTNTRKFTVRAALVTGSTLATIVGAQMIAVRQEGAPEPDGDENAASITIEPVENPALTNPTPVATLAPSATVVIQHQAPSIVILRQPGSSAVALNQPQANPQSSPRQILPPQPVALSAPDPLVIQPDPIIVQPPPIVVSANNNSGSSSSGGSSRPRGNSSR